MVYFQTKNTNLGQFCRIFQCMMLVFLWPFGLSFGHLVFLGGHLVFLGGHLVLSRFGMLHQEKSGNPGSGKEGLQSTCGPRRPGICGWAT
jgi:hypothetical protein